MLDPQSIESELLRFVTLSVCLQYPLIESQSHVFTATRVHLFQWAIIADGPMFPTNTDRQARPESIPKYRDISPIRMTPIKYPRNPLYPSTTKQDDLRFIREDELSNDMASDLYQSPLLDVQPDLDAPLLQHQSLQRYRCIIQVEG